MPIDSQIIIKEYQVDFEFECDCGEYLIMQTLAMNCPNCNQDYKLVMLVPPQSLEVH